MVLLHLVVDACRKSTSLCHSVCVVHVHHGLRAGADADAEFVQKVCAENGIPCQVIRVHVDVSGGGGIESAARQARYDALRDTANSVTNPVLLVAHHQMDQVETFLLRWLRGTGLHGLGAMRSVSDYACIPLLRPLLSVDQQTIAEYASDHDVPYVIDETNGDTTFTRNDLRAHVVPELQRIQSDLGPITGRLTEQLQMDDDYLNMKATEVVDRIIIQSADSVITLNRKLLIDAHVSLQRRAIHILLNCFATRGWTYRHVENILQIATQVQRPSVSLALPHGLRVWRRYDHLYIGCAPSPSHSGQLGTQVWNLEQSHHFSVQDSSLGWRFWALSHPAGLPRGSLWRLWLPTCRTLDITFDIALDCRLRPLGLKGSKKVQDIFTDQKVPRHLRSNWPIFSVDGEVVWIPGVVRTEAARIQRTKTAEWVIVAHLPQRNCVDLGHLMKKRNV